MAEQVEAVETSPEVASRLEEGRYLPPIYRLRMPETKTQTAKVRWLWELGYPVKEIAKGLGVKYQQVRNMVTTVPKRAAREDLPELKVEVLDLPDAVDAIMDKMLDDSLLAGRKERQKARGRNQFLGPEASRAGSANPEEDDEDYQA